MASATMELYVPRPVLIFNDMRIEDWKKYFIQKAEDEIDSTAKFSYTKCFKALMWAEFCNGTLSYVGNSCNDHGFTVKFTFQFTSFSCMVLFQKHLAKNIEITTMI